MDEPSEIIGSKHRMYRHDPYNTPTEAKTLFGEYADQACLDHIRADMRSWRRQGLKASPRAKSPLPSTAQGILALFFAFVFFMMGLLFLDPIAIKHGGWLFSLVFWFLAFLSFLGFLATIGNTTKEEPKTYRYELEMKFPEWKMREPDEEKENENNTSQNKNDN